MKSDENRVQGKAKELEGKLIGDKRRESEGKAQNTAGKAQRTVQKAVDRVKGTRDGLSKS